MTSDGGQNLEAAWSPDGSRLAYHSLARGGIWLIPALGGLAQQLADFGSKPSWSPDGTAIVFRSGPLTDVSMSSYPAMPPSTLWTCSVDGGEPTQLTRKGEPPGGHGSPTWSPDGDRILFLTADWAYLEVWSVPASGGEPTPIPLGGIFPFDLVHSPRGDRLFFTGASDSSGFGLWSVELDSETKQPTSTPTVLARANPATIRHPSVSADGSLIAYAALSMTSDLASLTVSQNSFEGVGKPTSLTDDTALRSHVASFSPDGDSLVYRRSLRGGGSEIWLLDGAEAKPIVTGEGYLDTPQWLNLDDGEPVVFLDARHGRIQLTSVDVDTGRERLFHEVGANWGSQHVSPDGTSIAFSTRQAGPVAIWTVPTGSQDARVLVESDEDASFPVWSPDGRFLAFQLFEGASTHIAFVPADGGTPVQLTHDLGQSWPWSWSPDSKRILFAGQRDGVWNVRWVSRVDGTQTRMTDYETLHHYVRYPVWSPDGDQIVYEYAETHGNIWWGQLR